MAVAAEEVAVVVVVEALDKNVTLYNEEEKQLRQVIQQKNTNVVTME